MTTLSWNIIKTRAKRFAKDWADAGYEKGQTQHFYRDFFHLFGTDPRRLIQFEYAVKKLNKKYGFIDLFWPGMLLIEQKSAGRDLTKAKQQAFDYFNGLKPEELPRYVLVSDFQRFELLDLKTLDENGEPKLIQFKLEQLPDFIREFAFIRGDVEVFQREQQAVNFTASEHMGKLHKLLYQGNYRDEDLQTLLTRLVFCLFADSTHIFDEDGRPLFTQLIQNRSAAGGRDLGRLLIELFEVLNTPPEKRQQAQDEELVRFPYINGGLFEGNIRTPVFDEHMRAALLDACAFDWQAISPAIFGSLFQSVMEDPERRKAGAHYTSEAHIERLIKPLFLDELTQELDDLCRKRRGPVRNRKFIELQEKLAYLTFFDPACGCGNFLVVAYQRLRGLETRLLREMHQGEKLKKDRQGHLSDAAFSKVNVHQFYGIELLPFPAKIAQVALWMVDHLCNMELSAAFGEVYRRIPLTASPPIVCADALEIDWQQLLPAEKCSYILGNPPFIGKSYQSTEQNEQMRRIAALPGTGGGSLDYVCAWFIKAAQYIHSTLSPSPSLASGRGELIRALSNTPRPLAGERAIKAESPPQMAFVSTNSITQGEQVAQLWPLLLDQYAMEISFAHRTFNWTSEAKKGMAHVHVVIIGLTARGFELKEKRLFSYPDIKGEPILSQHKVLSPYLIDGSTLTNPYLVVRDEKYNLSGYPTMTRGAQATDKGHYIFSDEEKVEFLKIEPSAEKFFRPYIGAYEFINNGSRWILVLHQAQPQELRKLPAVLKRIEAVKQFRLASKKKATQLLAQTPTRLENHTILPEHPFLLVPRVSSEQRDYIPIGYVKPPVIPSDAVQFIENAELWHFAILTAQIHMAWMRQFAGRLESRYRYSIGVVYNTFPWPENLQNNNPVQEKLNQLARAILDVRANYPDSTLADLYHTQTMPPDLRKAHSTLDKFVDKLYQTEPFKDDSERVALLLARYEQLIQAKTVS